MLGFACKLDVMGIHRLLSEALPEEAAEQAAAEEVKANSAFLGAQSTLTEVIAAVRELGYELSAEDNGKVYEEFRRVAAKKAR